MNVFHGFGVEWLLHILLILQMVNKPLNQNWGQFLKLFFPDRWLDMVLNGRLVRFPRMGFGASEVFRLPNIQPFLQTYFARVFNRLFDPTAP